MKKSVFAIAIILGLTCPFPTFAAAQEECVNEEDCLSKYYDPKNLWDYGKQIHYASRMIAMDPKDYNYILRCHSYYRKGDYAEALSDCNKAIELNEEFDKDYYRSRADVYLALHKYLEAIADYTVNINSLEESISAQLSTPNMDEFQAADLADRYSFIVRSLSGRGDAFIGLGAYDAAIHSFTTAILWLKSHALWLNSLDADIRPGDFNLEWDMAHAYERRADAHLLAKNFQEVIENYNRAMEFSADDARLLAKRGNIYVIMEKNDEALKDANAAIKLNPEECNGYIIRGLVYMRQTGGDEKALSDLGKAAQLCPDNPSPYHLRGLIFNSRGAYDRAISDFNKAIELNSEDVEYYKNRGLSRYLKHDYGKALEDINKALSMNQTDSMLYSHRGDIYSSMAQDEPNFPGGLFSQAIADYDTAIELDPENYFAYIGRGQAYQNQKDFDRARIDYNQAIALDPKNALTYRFRAILYKERGWVAEAIKDYEKLLSLDPEVDDADKIRDSIKKMKAKK